MLVFSSFPSFQSKNIQSLFSLGKGRFKEFYIAPRRYDFFGLPEKKHQKNKRYEVSMTTFNRQSQKRWIIIAGPLPISITVFHDYGKGQGSMRMETRVGNSTGRKW